MDEQIEKIAVRLKLKKKPIKQKIKKLTVYVNRVEYFDDRFYKCILPLNTNKDLLKAVPSNYIFESADSLDVYLPSVTTIIGNTIPKPFLESWRGDVGNSRADEIISKALHQGRVIHEAIDHYAHGGAVIFKTPEITDKMIKEFRKATGMQVYVVTEQAHMVQLARYQRIVDLLQPKIVSSEQTLLSLDYCCAGTRDQLWEFTETKNVQISRDNWVAIEPGLYTVDFKTGKSFSDEDYYTQVATYSKIDDMADKINGSLILHLNANIKTGIEGSKVYQMSKGMNEMYFKHYLKLKEIFDFAKKDITPTVYEFPQVIYKGLEVIEKEEEQA